MLSKWNLCRLASVSWHCHMQEKDRSPGGIIRWAAGPSAKSPLEKVAKDQQRGHADKPHPILELKTGDGVVIEKKFRYLFPHTATMGDDVRVKEKPRRIGGAEVGRPCWEGQHT